MCESSKTSRQAKVTAAEQDCLQEESDYERAHREFIEIIEEGFDLSTYGEVTWTRAKVHER